MAYGAIMVILIVFSLGFDLGEPLKASVQTAPLWLAVVLGWRGVGYARWAAAPILAFWAVIAAAALAAQLGLAHIGIADLGDVPATMAAVILAFTLAGFIACVMPGPRISPLTGITLALACGAAQIGAYYLGLQIPLLD